MRFPAPAKINLALHVTGRRPDGYHMIETLVVFAEAGDVVSVAAADRDHFKVTGRFADAVPRDRGNLVLAARDLLRSHAGASATPVSIGLEKNLPAASGLGGGSSDAAATLRALCRLWSLDAGDLARLALPLGADLPMCLAARPLVARGIGEEIAPLAAFPALDLVLVNPGVPVSTPAVFSALASRENPPLPTPGALAAAGDVVSYLQSTRNDLEPPAKALAPQIGEAHAELRHAGALFARMSGSGATCFGIFADADAAARAASAIAARRPGWYCVATRTMAA